MRLRIAVLGALLGMCAVSAQAYDVADWPTHYKFADGADIGFTGNYQYERDEFSSLSGIHATSGATSKPISLPDQRGPRKQEFGATLKKDGVYDAVIVYDFWNNSWMDVALRLQSKALFGADYGAIRFGYTKTYVGFEGATSSRADSFLELALPSQALYEGRRTGVDWAFERPAWRIDLGAYAGQDLQGDNDGSTFNARAAWTPIKVPKEGRVLHLGLALSQENPDRSTVDGRGRTNYAARTVNARPDAFLVGSTRFVSSGAISKIDSIDRYGLEGLWIAGPWSLQGEYLRADYHRVDGLPGFTATGYYLFGSYVLTGEARPYANGNVGNLKPKNRGGAVELLLRYDELDLDDGAIHGGRQDNWTLGLNWYLINHFRVQANYIFAHEKGNPAFNRGGAIDPRIFLLRAQLFF